MFAGIIQGLCRVASVREQAGIRRLEVALGDLAEELSTGASVAVNGVCLTVSGLNQANAAFDVIQETLNSTNLGAIAAGRQVNVERSLRFGDEVGGHVLSGHILGTAQVEAVETGAGERNLWLGVRPEWLPYLHHKGFTALDGASLTIAAVDAQRRRIKVCLIPETIARTTLGRAEVGAAINLEVDPQTRAVVETVERMLQARG